MTELHLGAAIDRAIELAMAEDERIVVFGEDVPMLRSALLSRFGGKRVFGAPISESAFLGAATTAAMGGLRPIVELYMVDFMAVGFDAVVNHMAKVARFSAGRWNCPLLIRAPSGGGYGDGGQHAQTLWGMLAAIPGLTVLVPSTPRDAYGLTRAALTSEGPVVLMEPKLLSADWLEFLGRLGRDQMDFDVPAGASGEVDETLRIQPGQARVCLEGTDVTIVSVAVGVHRALEAAAEMDLSCEVIDLRSVRPLDTECLANSVCKTGRLVVIDEDYQQFGLAAEVAAVCLERGLAPRFRRVCVEDTLPYNAARERQALPNRARIIAAVESVRN